jgi:PST family polysaccharide transporter
VSPQEFGLLAMITIFTNFGRIFIDFGFSSAIIQKKNVTQRTLSTVFWFNILSGSLLTILFFSAAGLIAAYYNKPVLTSITRVISFSFLVASVTSVQSAQLTKKLDFKSQALITWAATIVASGVSIYMAYKGYGVWSLVVQALINSTLTSLCYWFSSRWRPSFIFDLNELKAILKFGGSVAGDTIFNYWTRNMDNLMVGKMLGDGPLGIYNRAYNLMLLPLNNITRTVTRVMFPAFSSIQDDIPRTKMIYLKISRTIAFIAFPLMFGLCAVSKPFILFAYGDKWAGVIPILQVLSILGALQAVISLNGIIYNSQGKAHMALRATIIMNVALIIAFYIGIHYWGLMGLAWAYFFIAGIGSIPVLYFATRLINTSLLEQALNLSKIFASSSIMAILLYFIGRTSAMQSLGYLKQLCCLTALGILIYFSLVFLLKEKVYLELLLKYTQRTTPKALRESNIQVKEMEV